MVQKNERRSRGQLGSLKNPLEPKFADLPLRRKMKKTPRGSNRMSRLIVRVHPSSGFILGGQIRLCEQEGIVEESPGRENTVARNRGA